jgi:hypothetical protein
MAAGKKYLYDNFKEKTKTPAGSWARVFVFSYERRTINAARF